MDQPQQEGGIRTAPAPVNPLGPPPVAPPAAPPAAPPTAEAGPQVAQQQVQQPGQQQQNTTATPTATTTVTIQQSVGSGGINMPADVLQVQNRLVTLGYLSATDFAAEQANTTSTTRIADTALRATINAISRYFQANFGRPGMLIEPNQASSSFLNRQPVAAVTSTTLTNSVGEGGQNDVADVRLIQARLSALGYLSAAHATTEAPAAAATGRVADASLPQTIAAIQRFNNESVGTSLRVFRPGSRELDALNNPPTFRTGNLTLSGSVGTGGQNNPSDVTIVQDRLLALGYLSAADRTAEAPAQGITTAIPVASLTQTIAAINQFQAVVSITPDGLVSQNNPTHRQLIQPVIATGRLRLNGTVGTGGANAPADVRNVQGRLVTLGFLTDAQRTAEAPASGVTTAVPQASLPLTIAALNQFQTAVGIAPTGIVGPNTPTLTQLLTPVLQAANEAIVNSVGTGGQNNPSDVTAVQNRLVFLGYLTEAHRTAERPAVGAAAAVAVANLVQTIAAINQFETAMGIPVTGQVAPGNATHRQMLNPTLHERSSMTLTGTVGTGGANTPADVRLVQDRLQSIGLLTTSNFMTERVDPAAASVNVANIPQTIAAINQFLQTVVGARNANNRVQVIGPDSRELRLLNDPSYGSNTNFNTEANNAQAGLDFQSNDAALNRIIRAIETAEAGNFTGEIGAVLTNGSGTATSFGRGQVIGGTAISTLQNNDDLAAHYGLTDAALTEMSDRATKTDEHYRATYALVPAGGSNAAQLTAAITTYTTTHGERFVRETGLGTEDIARMFHTANMRRRILAVNVARRQDTNIIDEAQIDPNVDALMRNGEFTNSTNFLGINRSSVRTYFRWTNSMGENRQGFITKAIFNHRDGQKVRNAMTDNNGTAIGRIFVEGQYNTVSGVVRQNDPNRARNIAAIVAIMHNTGGDAATHYTNINTTLGNRYVRTVLSHW